MKGYAGLLLMLSMLVSCSKDDSFHSTQVVTNRPNIQMVLTAKQVYTSNPRGEVLLKGVDVKVYSNAYNRTIHAIPVKYGTTDSAGRVYFEYLQSQDYFVEATYPHADTERITVNFPSGALVSYEDLMIISH